MIVVGGKIAPASKILFKGNIRTRKITTGLMQQ
jgi:hypothetical protein